jgi:cyclopropane-fatty-acyl-phospholipid synthase
MLYKFKSQAAADLIMLQPNGQSILQIIGKDSSASQGIILPEQMPMAIAALEAAIAAEDAVRKPAKTDAAESGKNLPRGDAITLRQRAVPFIDMLRRCEKAGKEIVWGV